MPKTKTSSHLSHEPILIFSKWFLGFVILASPLYAVDFEKDILPLLKNNCVECHGPEKSESGLRLDRRVGLLKGGDSGFPAIIPGKPEESFIIEAIKGTDPNLVMPKDGDRFTEKQIKLVEQWITEGAQWPGQMDDKVELKTDHWAYQPLVRPAVPSGAEHPVDAFLLDRLKKDDIKKNPPAGARELIRRASIILTGLPPAPERVASFEIAFAKNSDQAYEALVDELLDSKHFGERWAQHWLDVIRWAETNGSEANLYRRNAWLYRDYVIRAFNEDFSYDQFIKDQIAGDTRGVGEATGFLVAGPHVPAATVGQEPTAIRQARADRMDEVIQTVGASMMGVTMSCARCHNHKFDPVSIQDYYSMTGVFQDIEFGARFPELSKDHPRRERGIELRKVLTNQRQKVTGSAWVENWSAYHEYHIPKFEAKSLRITFSNKFVLLDELEIFGAYGKHANIARPERGTILKGSSHLLNAPQHMTRLTDGKYGSPLWRAKSKKGSDETPWIELTFSKLQKINRIRMSKDREYYIESDYLNLKDEGTYTDFVLEAQRSDGTWHEVLSTEKSSRKNAADPIRKAVLARINTITAQLTEEGPRTSFIGQLVKPVTTHVLHRGSPENPRDEVPPAAPLILDGDLKLSSKNSGPERRQKFAQWLAGEKNPLTARVMVNRIWHHTFGTGIVPTTSDFGIAGAKPTHPELLDWLAVEFMQPAAAGVKPWSMKSMIRSLVMTDAFRRSSQPNPASFKADSGSALLWRYPPRRVEAEVIRDSVLMASGRLDKSIGGRSYRIHNEKAKYAQWQVVDNYGAHTWRRMIYQERMRRVDDRIFTAFDFPDCGQIREKRPVSTTPLQALNLMNSPFVVDQSMAIAERAKNESKGTDTAAAVTRCFELILTRKPQPDELTACVKVADTAGLNIVCRTLINSNEFAFLP